MLANRKRPLRPKIEYHTITADDIANKGFSLEKKVKSPELTDFSFYNEGGILQRYGLDYTINENMISWESLGLENFEFLVGDEIQIKYYY